jgi:hypothetical protein
MYNSLPFEGLDGPERDGLSRLGLELDGSWFGYGLSGNEFDVPLRHKINDITGA